MKALFDTNILIDYLNGVEAARKELALYEDPAISLVSWIEVLVGATGPREPSARRFMARFHVVPITELVAEEAVVIRRSHRLRLPDAVIWASALTSGRLLVTRNLRDFPESHPGIRAPYRL